jgi:hypothetical protein
MNDLSGSVEIRMGITGFPGNWQRTSELFLLPVIVAITEHPCHWALWPSQSGPLEETRLRLDNQLK